MQEKCWGHPASELLGGGVFFWQIANGDQCRSEAQQGRDQVQPLRPLVDAEKLGRDYVLGRKHHLFKRPIDAQVVEQHQRQTDAT